VVSRRYHRTPATRGKGRDDGTLGTGTRTSGAFVELYVAGISAGFAALLTVWQVLGLASGRISQELLPWVLPVLCVTLYRDRLTDRKTARSVKSLQSDLATNTGTLGRMIEDNAEALRRGIEDSTATLARAVQENTAAIRSLTRNGLFRWQDEPYRKVIDHINRVGAQHVLLLQYSGKNSSEVMTAAMRRGATVELFVEREETAVKIGSRKQQDQIASTRWQELSARRTDYPRATLTVMESLAPMSVRAVKVDEAVICVGSYTYEEVDRNDRYKDDKVTVSGHDRPRMFVWAGTPEYDIYHEMITNMLGFYRAKATPVQF
jgi:hypothetical protein